MSSGRWKVNDLEKWPDFTRIYSKIVFDIGSLQCVSPSTNFDVSSLYDYPDIIRSLQRESQHSNTFYGLVESFVSLLGRKALVSLSEVRIINEVGNEL